MSITLLVWLALFVTFSVLMLRRSSWGIALYMLTYYVNPQFWWWGKSFAPSVQWNLTAALILAAGVLLDNRKRRRDASGTIGRVCLLLIIYGLNAALVHVLFAANPERSQAGLVLLWKQIGLFVLLVAAIKDRFDLKILIYAILAGALYIGYEVVINERGRFTESRLEGLGIANIGDSNYLAGLLSLSLPLGGCLLLIGSRAEKLFALVSLSLILDTILRCNSRGAFLAVITGGIWLLVSAKGQNRRRASAGIALACLAGFLLMRDPDIMNRFTTTFVSSEERDAAATSRMRFWTQGLTMVADHPFGSGAEAAFKSDLGVRYLQPIGIYKRFAVHNGYLDIAASWGIQGLIIYGAIIYLAWRRLRLSTTRARGAGQDRLAFLGVCMDAALVTQLVAAMFLSSLDSEVFFWWIAMALAFDRVSYAERAYTRATQPAEAAWEAPPDAELPPEPVMI